jgi:hypothetical protein
VKERKKVNMIGRSWKAKKPMIQGRRKRNP